MGNAQSNKVADPGIGRLLTDAVAAQRGGNPAEAIRLSQAVLERAPNHPDAMQILAVALAQLGRLPEATATFRRALTVAPNDGGLHFNFGILLTRTGDADTPNHQAITAFFVDTDAPGITVRPLHTMHDVDEFCEVYFDDVEVDASRMLGNPGDGWQLAMDLLPYERSTCFWQRIAYLYSRFDALVEAVKRQGQVVDPDLGEVYLALHTLRCRSAATQHRLAEGHKLGPDTSIDKVLLAGAEQLLYDTARNLLPGVIELEDSEWRTEYLYSRASTIYGGTAEVQRNIIARRLLDLGKE